MCQFFPKFGQWFQWSVRTQMEWRSSQICSKWHPTALWTVIQSEFWPPWWIDMIFSLFQFVLLPSLYLNIKLIIRYYIAPLVFYSRVINNYASRTPFVSNGQHWGNSAQKGKFLWNQPSLSKSHFRGKTNHQPHSIVRILLQSSGGIHHSLQLKHIARNLRSVGESGKAIRDGNRSWREGKRKWHRQWVFEKSLLCIQKTSTKSLSKDQGNRRELFEWQNHHSTLSIEGILGISWFVTRMLECDKESQRKW